MTVWNCLACGKQCEREPVRGQLPKWCEDCRARGAKRQVKCAHCGVKCWTWHKGRYCSRSCATLDHERPELKPKPIPKTQAELEAMWRAQRSPVRAAIEDGDPDLFFAALVAQANTTGDCWVWPRLNRSGYPTVRLGKREVALHRVVLEIKHGAPLGSQHAHHICANAACVNPDHLQPITHRDNVAEMLARQSYLTRIRELEAALAEVRPNHPLLDVVTVA